VRRAYDLQFHDLQNKMGDTLLTQVSLITILVDKLFLNYPLVYSLLNSRFLLWLEYYSI